MRFSVEQYMSFDLFPLAVDKGGVYMRKLTLTGVS